MTRFVTERPEISFAANDKHYIILVPVHHAELLSARNAPSPSQQKPRPAAGAKAGGVAGGDGSDPEDYLAGQRGSKRRGSTGRREDSPGRERDRDRDRDGERGKEKRTPGSEGPRGGDRREQQPAWQEDRQRYEGRDSRGAADRDAASPPRRAAGGAAGAGPSPPFPGAPRSQERANRYSVGSAKTGSGRDPVGGPPPVLDPRTATDALRDYGKFLEEDLRGPGRLHEEGAYKILPLPLADR
jgi:hypothetical protein